MSFKVTEEYRQKPITKNYKCYDEEVINVAEGIVGTLIQ